MSEKERTKGIEEGATASKWRRLKDSLLGRRSPAPVEELKPEPPKSEAEAEIFSSSLSPQTEPPTEKGSREKKSQSGSQKRRRNKKVFVVCDDAECAAIIEKAANARLSTSAYARACLLGDKGPRSKRGIPVNAALIGSAIAALNRVGNNLNQIAHHLNAGGHPDAKQITEAKAQLADCLSAILKSLGKAE